MGVKWQKQGDYALVSLSGKLITEEILAALDEVFGSEPLPHIIWDLTQSIVPLSFPTQYRKIAEYGTQFMPYRGEAPKTAVVIDDELGFRNTEALAKQAEGLSHVRMKVFRQLPKAVEWIEEA